MNLWQGYSSSLLSHNDSFIYVHHHGIMTFYKKSLLWQYFSQSYLICGWQKVKYVDIIQIPVPSKLVSLSIVYNVTKLNQSNFVITSLLCLDTTYYKARMR